MNKTAYQAGALKALLGFEKVALPWWAYPASSAAGAVFGAATSDRPWVGALQGATLAPAALLGGRAAYKAVGKGVAKAVPGEGLLGKVKTSYGDWLKKMSPEARRQAGAAGGMRKAYYEHLQRGALPIGAGVAGGLGAAGGLYGLGHMAYSPFTSMLSPPQQQQQF
jgi:hypothetical protein